jgi:hypothetical protein
MAKASTRSLTWSVVIPLVSSVVGVLLGGAIQYFVTVRTQDAKLWAELRTKAYVQYLDNTAKLELQDPTKKEEIRALRFAARYAIGLYGSKRVAQTMAAYAPVEHLDATTEEIRRRVVDLLVAMRDDLVPTDQQVDGAAMSTIIFRSEPFQKTAP